jgi:hypothetical protein
MRPCPQLGSIEPKADISLLSKTYSQYLIFLLQTSNCSRDKLCMQEEGTGRNIETRRTCPTYFSRPAMKIKIMLPGNYLECDIVCMWNKIFYHSFILKDYISLQAICQMFVSPLVRLRQPISHSQRSLIHSHLIYPTHNASLLSMIFTSVRLLYIIMSHDHSDFVTELNEFDVQKSEKVEMWISRSVRWKSK